MTTSSSAEIQKFTTLADKWWDLNGPFKTLHEINPVRMEYVCGQIRKHIGREDIKDVSILDIGCGGGIVSVPLARLGGKVTGVDMGQENIDAAKQYAKTHKLNIKYICGEISSIKDKYDVITCLEVVEHVDNLEKFVIEISKLLKPGGLVIFSTINRTLKAFALAIGVAEYLTCWVPRGTHSFDKFVKPSELANLCEQNQIILSDIKGMSYNIISRKWLLADDIDINYFLTGYTV